jgi:hypothetical protein
MVSGFSDEEEKLTFVIEEGGTMDFPLEKS